MTLGRVLLDTAVFVYAVGAEHDHREPCRQIVTALASGRAQGEVSVEAVQEFLHVRARRTGDRAAAADLARQVATLSPVHDVTVADLRLALTLFEDHPALEARDAVHAATAINRGIGVIVSPDRGFDGLPGLRRLDPAAAAARLAA